MSNTEALTKRRLVVESIAERIRNGEFAPGEKLSGEHQLAEEFSVSRGTIRQALSDLQQRKLITTRSGLGSFVAFQGHRLDRTRGWAQALAETGLDIVTRVLDISPVTREEITGLPDDVVLGKAIAVRRVRSIRNDDGTERPISFECSSVPAIGPLADLPVDGLRDGSLWASLNAAGLVASAGRQRVDVHRLDAREALLLGQPEGTGYLRSMRTSFDAEGTFVEHVVSLLDPSRFSLVLDFGE